VGIDEYPDIPGTIDGFWMEGLDIQYSTDNNNGKSEASRVLVMTNWRLDEEGARFGAEWTFEYQIA